MPSINIDFEVFKELTIRRRSEDMTENDVVRDLLNLPKPTTEPSHEGEIENIGIPWVTKGVSFSEGTEFRATYKGRQHNAIVRNGALELNGTRHPTPSSAAVSITGNAVNGWRFWEFRLPGTTKWKSISTLRK